MTSFSRISFQVTKNGSFITIFNAKGNELIRMNTAVFYKRRISWQKSYVVVIVELPQYYSFSVFKPQSDNQCIYSGNLCMKILENVTRLSMRETLCFSLKNAKSYSARMTQENIGFRLICSIPYTIFTRHCNK